VKRLLLVVLLLAGCSAHATENLQVTIEANKQTIEAFEPVLITASVEAAGKPVITDAEVDFELIHPSGKTIGTVNPTNNGDGTYSIETSFDAEGVYRIISHVDHGHEHEMPEVEVTVN
jgi:uncharacterized protein YfaS (alpha-2-macroglobulin family)